MTRFSIAILCFLLAVAAPAGVKVGGVEFIPKDLIFASADSSSEASAEGALPNDCQWSFAAATRIGRREDAQRCVRFYYKTTVTLMQTCPVKDVPPTLRLAERIIATENRCPDSAGRVKAPPDQTTALSSGTTADGRRQEIVRQPDGTRLTLSYDHAAVMVRAAFPDGTTDILKLP